MAINGLTEELADKVFEELDSEGFFERIKQKFISSPVTKILSRDEYIKDEANKPDLNE